VADVLPPNKDSRPRPITQVEERIIHGINWIREARSVAKVANDHVLAYRLDSLAHTMAEVRKQHVREELYRRSPAGVMESMGLPK